VASAPKVVLVGLDDDGAPDDRVRTDQLDLAILDIKCGDAVFANLDIP
jgi:hypothetical protein